MRRNPLLPLFEENSLFPLLSEERVRVRRFN
jgi:hypothetical protein